jgi:hypothetical protein
MKQRYYGICFEGRGMMLEAENTPSYECGFFVSVWVQAEDKEAAYTQAKAYVKKAISEKQAGDNARIIRSDFLGESSAKPDLAEISDSIFATGFSLYRLSWLEKLRLYLRPPRIGL